MGDKSCYKLIGSLYDEDHTIHIYEDKLKRIRLKKWINKDGELHRLDGPAYIRQTFDEIPITKKWYEYGSLHREWGPAYKPAYINLKTMHKAYFIDGVAVEDFCMTKRALK